MVSPDELLMGALPYIPQSPGQTVNIGQGTAGTAPGTAAAIMGGSTAVSGGTQSTGTAILITWFLILFILVACNIFTLRVQR